MCSSYDYSQEAVDELTEKLNAVSSDVAEIIASDKLFEYFLSELEIDIQGNQ